MASEETASPGPSLRLAVRRTALALAAAAALAWLSILAYRPPTAKDTAPPEDFSAGRALQRLEIIAQSPHSTGSSRNFLVRDYLLTELRALGCETSVARHSVDTLKDHPPVPVENIVARRKGTANTRALLLCAHYDSARHAPGAGDDGVAVAALLETLRALQSAPPLQNDLIVLLTDGEERGLLGARGFAAEHPWIKDVGLVCNFDARGNRGPLIMYETSNGNAPLIEAFSRAGCRIIANSIADYVYQLMANRTDFTVFKHVGCEGLNFAFIGGVEVYHQPSDTIENVSHDTLQHTGDTMLRLASHFGNRELPLPRTVNAIYFNALGPWFVHYPESWSLAMGISLGLLAVVALWLQRRRQLTRVREILLSVTAALVSCALAGLAGWAVLLLRAPRARMVLVPDVYCFAALAIGIGVAAVALRWIARRATDLENAIAAAVIWTACALLLSWKISGASYLFYWPAAAAWLGFALHALLNGRGMSRTYSFFSYAARSSGAWVGIALISPLCSLIWSALPLGLPVIALLATLFVWPLFARVLAPPVAHRV